MKKINCPNVAKNLFILLIVSLVFAIYFQSNAYALTSDNINFQGKIVRNDTGFEGLNVVPGSPACVVDGAGNDTCDFQVAYYTASTAGTLLLTETFTNVEIGQYDGVFELSLGSGSMTTTGQCRDGTCNTPVEVISEYKDVYLELKFSPDGTNLTETFTRMPLEASPYAILSKYAEGANDAFKLSTSVSSGSQASPVTGMVYYNTTTSQLTVYNGTSWEGIKSSLWTDAGTFTYLTSTTDDLVLGASTVSDSTFFFDMDGSSGSYLEIDDASNTNRLLTILSGGNVGIGTATPGAKLEVAGSSSTITNASGDLTISTGGLNGNILLSPNGSGSVRVSTSLGIRETGTTPTYYTFFQGGDQTGDISYTLPVNDGDSSEVLTTDGSGVLSWNTVASSSHTHSTLSQGTGIASFSYNGSATATVGFDYTSTLTSNSLGANTTLFGSTGILFEGSTSDTYETLLTVTNPTSSDKTITLPNATGTVSLGTGTTNYVAYWSGTNTLGSEQYLATSRGGLGANVTAVGAGELLYSTGTTAYGSLAAGTSGQILKSGGAVAPTWNTAGALTKTDDTNVTLTLGGSASTALVNAASITVGWSGTLAATRGGTGLGTYATGDILYASALNTLSARTIGTAGQVLTVVSGVPQWVTPDAGHSPVTLAGENYLSIDANQVLTASDISLTNNVTGTLGIANGGTNAISYTSSQFLWYNGTSIVASGYDQNSFASSSHTHSTLSQGTGIASFSYNGSATATVGFDYTSTLTSNSLGANTTLFGSTGILFEGSTSDTYETLLTVTNPTSSDKTITLPNATGTVALTSDLDFDKYEYWTIGDGSTTQNVGSKQTMTISGGNGISAVLGGTRTVTVSTNATTCSVGQYSYWTGTAWLCRDDVDTDTDTDTNDYVDFLSFNTSDGVLTIGRTGALADLTTNFDGRYALSGAGMPSGEEGQMLYNNAGTWTAFNGMFWDDTNNRLGVGTTGPTAKLEIVTATSTTAIALLVHQQENSGTMYGTYSVADGVGATNNIAGYFSSTGATNNYGLLVANGNVGIGTTTPSNKFVVNTSGYSTIELQYGGTSVVDIFSNASSNIFIGLDSGSVISTGTGNIALGDNALSANTTGLSNTAIGHYALDSNVAKQGSTALGYQAMMYANSTATAGLSYNTAIGYQALTGSGIAANNTGTQNTAVGHQSLTVNTTGSQNTAIGVNTLNANTTGTQNVAIGQDALFTNVAKQGSVAIGYEAMRYADSTATAGLTYNTAIGFNTLRGSNISADNSGTNNTAVGASALVSNTSGSNNVAIGVQTMYINTTGHYNVAIGDSALSGNIAKQGSVAIGYAAMKYADSTSTAGMSYNTALGYEALRGGNTPPLNTGTGNTVLGYQAGYVMTSGSNNTLLGYLAGDSLTSGGNNIMIGYNTDGTAGTSNQLNIGNTIYGNLSNDYISIGDSTPTEGMFTVGATSQFRIDTNGDLTRIKDVPYTWPSSNASGILANNGSGALSWSTLASLGGVTGTGAGTATAGQITWWNGTSTITGENDFYWDATNNRLGIGTSSPTASIDIAGASSTISNASGNITITPASNLIVSQGNVGIGTTSPFRKLEVAGTSDTAIFAINPGTATGSVYTEMATKAWGASYGMMWNAYEDTNDLINGDLWVTGNTKFKDDNDGYSKGAYAIGGILNTPRFGIYFGGISTGADQEITWTQQAQFSDTSIWLSTEGTSRDFYLNSSGIVGIGTTSPISTANNKLDVFNSTTLTNMTVSTVDYATVNILSGTVSGTYGFGDFSVNAYYDGSTWTKRNTSYESWIMGLATRQDSAGKIEFVHSDAGTGFTMTKPMTIKPNSVNFGDYLEVFSGNAKTVSTPFIRASSGNNLVLNAYSTGGVFVNWDATGSGGFYVGDGAGTGSANYVFSLASGVGNRGRIYSQANDSLANSTDTYAGMEVGPYRVAQAASSNTLYEYYSNASSVAYRIMTTGTAMDLAEWYPVGNMDLDTNGNSKLKKGEILCLDNNDATKVVKCDSTHTNVVGIVSTASYTTMGIKDMDDLREDDVEVALTGRVPAIVTSKKGPIAIGDFITYSDLRGVGQKATSKVQVVAKALDTFNPSSCSPASSLESISWPFDENGDNPTKPCYKLPDGTYVGKIMVFPNISVFNPNETYTTKQLINNGWYRIAQLNGTDGNAKFKIKNNSVGSYQNLLLNIDTVSDKDIVNIVSNFTSGGYDISKARINNVGGIKYLEIYLEEVNNNSIVVNIDEQQGDWISTSITQVIDIPSISNEFAFNGVLFGISDVLQVEDTGLKVGGDLIASTTTANIGDTTSRWNDIYAKGAIRLGSGSGQEGAIRFNTESKRLELSNDGSTWVQLGDLTSQMVISPEYPGAILFADGSDNLGKMTSDAIEENATFKNYYEWISNKEVAQDYDILVRITLPNDFVSWKDDAIYLDYMTQNSVSVENNSVDVTLIGNSGVDAQSVDHISTLPGAWERMSLKSLDINDCNAPGDSCTLRISLTSSMEYFVRVGDITLNYNRSL